MDEKTKEQVEKQTKERIEQQKKQFLELFDDPLKIKLTMFYDRKTQQVGFVCSHKGFIYSPIGLKMIGLIAASIDRKLAEDFGKKIKEAEDGKFVIDSELPKGYKNREERRKLKH